MLKEIRQQNNDATHKNRRWFQDPEMGLFVWTDSNNLVERFQLIYLAYGTEHTLQWSGEGGLKNFDTETSRYQSAILSEESYVDLSALRENFEAISTEIDPNIRSLVINKLATYSLDSGGQHLQPSSSTSTTKFLFLMFLVFSIGIGFISLLTVAK